LKKYFYYFSACWTRSVPSEDFLAAAILKFPNKDLKQTR
jgi:hypothetical protein